MSISAKPLLRPLDFQPVFHQGQRMWLLRDPLQLSQGQLIFPQALAQMLVYLDGSASVSDIHRQLCADLGQDVPFEIVVDAIEQLDNACLLDNERSRNAQVAQLQAYRAQSARPPALAGLSYPADSAELTTQFTNYSNGDDLNGWPEWHGRGIISPHIDYERGGSVYAKTWQRARAAVKNADLVLMFGTDHNGGAGSITLTKVPYATPYGIIPTDELIVDQLAAAVGEDAYQLELNHKQEHAIELSAVWFHHIRGQNPCPMIPILCGSFYHFTPDGHPSQNARLTNFVDVLRRVTAGRKVLAVASVDLAHVGPAFDSEYLVHDAQRKRIADSDHSLRTAIANGDSQRFYREIAVTRNANNICGFSSIYLMLQYLGETTGIDIAYAQCEADQDNTSIVSICGMLLD
jgi:AmmeMemoRadiSam system protein B